MSGCVKYLALIDLGNFLEHKLREDALPPVEWCSKY